MCSYRGERSNGQFAPTWPAWTGKWDRPDGWSDRYRFALRTVSERAQAVSPARSTGSPLRSGGRRARLSVVGYRMVTLQIQRLPYGSAPQVRAADDPALGCGGVPRGNRVRTAPSALDPTGQQRVDANSIKAHRQTRSNAPAVMNTPRRRKESGDCRNAQGCMPGSSLTNHHASVERDGSVTHPGTGQSSRLARCSARAANAASTRMSPVRSGASSNNRAAALTPPCPSLDS